VEFYWLDLSPDGKQLAMACADRSVRLWDIAARSQVTLSGHTTAVIRGAFSPDGKILASASADGTVRLWSPITHELLAVLRGHQGPVIDVDFSADSRTLVSASYDKTVKLWDLKRILAPQQSDIFTERGGPAWCVAI